VLAALVTNGGEAVSTGEVELVPGPGARPRRSSPATRRPDQQRAAALGVGEPGMDLASVGEAVRVPGSPAEGNTATRP
jgi:hypothetical protein